MADTNTGDTPHPRGWSNRKEFSVLTAQDGHLPANEDSTDEDGRDWGSRNARSY